MESHDDDLKNFEAHGAAPLPVTSDQGFVDHDGARIWYATYGSGSPVILLHGGLGHSGNWGYQVSTLVSSGYRAVLIDSRGHGRSTHDQRPFTYELMASDVLAVMDALQLEKTAVVGWSDGACIALIVAMKAPERVVGVFFFGCNMDPSGTKEFEPTPIVDRCFRRHAKDYADLSATPDQFNVFVEAVGQMMKSEPNYSAGDLTHIHVPVAIVQSEHDEFITPEHAEYLGAEHSGSGIDHPVRRKPLRTAAKARAIQRRDACFPRQGSFLKEDDARRRLASPLSGCSAGGAEKGREFRRETGLSMDGRIRRRKCEINVAQHHEVSPSGWPSPAVQSASLDAAQGLDC